MGIILGNDCNFQRVQLFPLPGTNYTLVRFNNQRCGDNVDFNQSFIFCEGSGWGNNEASVVCRHELHSNYGFASKPACCQLCNSERKLTFFMQVLQMLKLTTEK